jgi:hypothetical protein
LHSAAGWRIEPPVSVPVAAGTAGRTAGNALVVPRITHRTKVRGFVRRTHRKLVHVGLAQRNEAGLRFHLADHRRVVGRDEIGQHLRTAGRSPAFGAENVLLGDRDTGQRAGRFDTTRGGKAGICGAGHFQAFFGVDRNKGIQGRVQARDALEKELRQFDTGNLLGGQGLRQLLEAGVDHSITLGTR